MQTITDIQEELNEVLTDVMAATSDIQNAESCLTKVDLRENLACALNRLKLAANAVAKLHKAAAKVSAN